MKTKYVLVLLLLLVLWQPLMYRFGYVAEPINVSGTGSMYPTFPKGEGKDPKALSKQIVGTPGMFRYPNGILLFGKRYFHHVISRGDIVVAENNVIREISKKLYDRPGGIVKRVIAIPGDTIQIRDGIVILNGQPQKEPYVARARSTFGGSNLSDCSPLTIPPHKYFLMGDNRKGSGDSRQDIGLVDESDIRWALPYKNQIGLLDKNWRDPSRDLDDTEKNSLDKNEFFTLLNQKRKELKSPELKLENKLSLSAQKRGEIILKYDDFSFEATRSGYSMTRATADAGYYNIVYGEWPILGYYEADELIDNLFEFPKGKDFLTNKEYDDFGVSEVQGQLNTCPTHLVVLHFAGYVPPNYTKDVIDSWKKALANLQDIQPGWSKLKEYTEFYDKHRDEVNRLNDIIAQRISNISQIVATMEKNQWLSQSQRQYITQDTSLQNELDSLTKKLNSY